MSKQSKSLPTKDMPKLPTAFSNEANGTMDYLSKQDKAANEDSSKLKRGAYKPSRYS